MSSEMEIPGRPWRLRRRRGQDGAHGDLPDRVRAEHRRPGRVLGRGRSAHRLAHRSDNGARLGRRAVRHRWFPDGTLNTCENALDRHVAAGHGDRAALVYDSPVTGTRRTYTYAQLLDETATFAGALASLGVDEGRPRRRLHADGPGGRRRDAGLRAAGRGALGRVRRLRGAGARAAHRRRAAQGRRVRVLRIWRATGSSSTSRCSTARSTLAAHDPTTWSCCSARRPRRR